MAENIDDARLRASHAFELVEYFKVLRTSVGPEATTAHLIDRVSRGTIQVDTAVAWIKFTRSDGAPVVAAIVQPHSVQLRCAAIKELGKALRYDASFAKTWNAAGEAPGFAAIMVKLSVIEVRQLCLVLGQAAGAVGAQQERQAGLSELLSLLLGAENPESRPLKEYYHRIVPACTIDVIRDWEERKQRGASPWSEKKRLLLFSVHPETYKRKLIEDVFTHGKPIDAALWDFVIREDINLAITSLADALAPGGELGRSPEEFMNKLLRPLAARLVSQRHLENGAALRGFETIRLFFRCYPAMSEKTNTKSYGFVHAAIGLWRRSFMSSYLLQAQRNLEAFITLLPKDQIRNVQDVIVLLSYAPPMQRWQLMRLIFLNAKQFLFDIEDKSAEGSIKLKSVDGKWSASLFTKTFPRTDYKTPLRLFEHLMHVRPAGDFIETSVSTSILHQKNAPDGHYGDAKILGSLLLRRSSATGDVGNETLNEALVEVEARKKKAATSREWENRAFWILSAWNLCIATGSLELYSEALLWARRFTRDVMTVKEIYRTQPSEAIELLTGICHGAGTAGATRATVQPKVLAANKIILAGLETAAMAIKEPSFYPHDWNTILAVPKVVTVARIQALREFQRVSHLSDDEVYTAVLEPTIRMLLQAEEFFLRPENIRLGQQSINGPLSQRWDLKETALRQHTWRFLDELCKARDELWKQYRPTHHPAVLTLPAPWPRGLPIQALGPLDLRKEHLLPYVLSRAEAVVFAQSRDVLAVPPAEDEVRAAIGPFVDDFKTALRTYVNYGNDCDQERRCIRARKAWHHAISSLTKERMSKVEAIRFWKRRFAEAGVNLGGTADLESELPKRETAKLPDVDDSGEPQEWDPDPSFGIEEAQSRELPLTVLDCMLEPKSAWASGPDIDRSFEASAPQTTVGVTSLSFFNSWESHFGPPSPVRPEKATAALLYINTKYGADSSLLMRPYPSAAMPLLPAVYLDHEFLERQDKSHATDSAMNVLEHSFWTVPLPLLVQLARSTFSKMTSGDKVAESQSTITMRLIKLIARSDRPSLAGPLIQEIVLERQNDSAWHREVFNVGYLKRLSADEAGAFLAEVSHGMQRKLYEQAHKLRDTGNNGKAAAATSGPAIKITTVKMLAKLLDNASFVAPSESVKILASLFQKSKHIDIRIAIIESLFATLDTSTTAPIKAEILALLETHAVPIASSLYEPLSATEADWAAAETGGDLPEVQDISGAVQRLFLHSVHRPGLSEEVKLALSKLLLRILESSMQNNRRWNNLFLKKHGIVLPPREVMLDRPAQKELLQELFWHWTEYMPRAVFDLEYEQLLEIMHPKPGLSAACELVRENIELRDSNAGKHWLSQYPPAGVTEESEMLGQGGYRHAALLQRPPDALVSKVPHGITVKMIQESVLELANILIERGEVIFLERLIEQLISSPDRPDPEGTWKGWKANGEPVARAIISRVETLRTTSWQKDPNRKPTVLPDTFRLELMITTPMPKKVDNDQLESYGNAIADLIDRVQSNIPTYHHRWRDLKEAVFKACRRLKNEQFSSLALTLVGRDNASEQLPSLAQCLRVELAEDCLQKVARVEKESEVEILKQLLQLWGSSEVEQFRGTATKLRMKGESWLKNEGL